MLVPLSWLRDYVALPSDPASLVERLTLAGLEAAGVRVFGPFQRIGIGTALIERGEELLRERGYHFATIAVERDNPDARRLYERLGYARIREVPRSWSYVDPDGRTRKVEVEEVLLRKEL